MNEMVKRKLEKHLPTQEEKILIQGRIPKSLFMDMKKIMNEYKYSWPDILIALCSEFVNEAKKK